MTELLPFLQDYGVGFIVAALIMSGWLYTKPQFTEMRNDRDFYRDRYFKTLDTAESAVDIAELIARRKGAH